MVHERDNVYQLITLDYLELMPIFSHYGTCG